MAERIGYTVVCNCTGIAEPIALIDDGRPVGGTLTVRGLGPEDTAVQFAVADGERHSDLYRNAVELWANYVVTETVWGDGHSTWTIRCDGCNDQVQIPDEQLLTIADHLAAAREQLPSTSTTPPRHELPLGVLIRNQSR